MAKINFFITNAENQDNASTLAQQYSGAVITLSTAGLINGQEFTTELWTLKVSSLEGFESITYADTGIEDALLSTMVISYSDLLPIGVFGISLPSFVPNQEKAILSYIADVLREQGYFATVVISDGSSSDSRTFTEDL